MSFKPPVENAENNENQLSTKGFGIVTEKLKGHAQEWTRYANIRFEFTDRPFEEGDIRISFSHGRGHYSIVGNVGDKDLSKPTMNFDPLDILVLARAARLFS